MLCKKCRHIQSQIIPPRNFPFIPGTGYQYKSIYPKQNDSEYADRKKRIYTPKLKWAIGGLKDLGYTNAQLKKMSWLEIGCGGGYFLSALEDFGMSNYMGLDKDSNMVAFAQSKVGKNKVRLFDGEPEEIFKNYQADIYVAFFVFEHLENSYNFFKTLSTLPKGTIVIFSVPFFGFINILEGMLPHLYARSLSAVVHTQTFTPTSIRYAMSLAKFQIVAEWIFGQDASDLLTKMSGHLNTNLPSSLNNEIWPALFSISDDIQSIIDKAHLSDQRHFLAIKT